MITLLNDLTHHASRRDVFALIASAIALAAIIPGRAAVAQCQYEVTAIIQHECDDFADSPTFGRGMNIHGEVVGYYWPCILGNDRAFYWSEETDFITLPTPPGVVRTWAYDINDNGLIVGQHEFDLVGRKGFVYDIRENDGEYIYLQPLHEDVVALNLSSANAINNSGVVAGMRVIAKPDDPQPLPYNAVIWRPFEKGAPVEDLGVMNGPNSAATDINDLNDVVGWHGSEWFTTNARAFLYADGKIVELGVPSGALQSAARSVNNSRTVVGRSRIPDPKGGALLMNAFLWENGTMKNIGTMPGLLTNHVVSINDMGQLFGGANLGGQTPFSAYMYLHGSYYAVPGEQSISGNIQGLILSLAATKTKLSRPNNIPIGDLNYDCNVDHWDLLMMLDQWSPVRGRGVDVKPTMNVPGADLNGDGVIDGRDLLILLANWG